MDDDYVARVLAKEARDSSRKYSAEGLGAYMPRKPAGNAPKPNTRFLRHLIKETDNHNTALKHKEEREARERMRQLGDQSTTGSTSTSQTLKRHDRPSSTRESERCRHEDREDRHRSHHRRHRSRSASTERDRSRRHRRRDKGYDGARERREKDRTEHRRDRHRHESPRRDRRDRVRSYSRSRSRSPHKDRSPGRHRSDRGSRRPKSPAGDRHRKERERRFKYDETAPPGESRSFPREAISTREHKSPSSAVTLKCQDSDDDSDPLEDLVGPLPPQKDSEDIAPIRSRGRGAYKPTSSIMDAHFASDYNPALDVQPDDDDGQSTGKRSSRRPVAGLMTGEDDWDMALEALRDRAHWRQKGEERLRAAGMNDSAIDRWKSNAAFAGLDGEGRPDDVRWSKKGEGREWDRGKVMDDEGHIDVQAVWK